MAGYAVNFWGSHPDNENDDCHSGSDFDTLEEALAAFKATPPSYVAYVELDGPDVYKVRKNPGYVASRDADDDWRREIAMQDGMGMGLDAYNEAMGWD